MPRRKRVVLPEDDITIGFSGDVKTIVDDMLQHSEFGEQYYDTDSDLIHIPKTRVNSAWSLWVSLVKAYMRKLKVPVDWRSSLYNSLFESMVRKLMDIVQPNLSTMSREEYERTLIVNKFKLELVPLLSFLYYISDSTGKDIVTLKDILSNEDPSIYGEVLVQSGIITMDELEMRKKAYQSELEARYKDRVIEEMSSTREDGDDED